MPRGAQFPARLGDHYPPHRRGRERPSLQLLSDLVQERPDPDLGRDPGHRGPVDPRRARPLVARHAFPRDDEHRRVTHQVEQIIKPATAVGDRPAVQFVLNPPYRQVRRRSGRLGGAGIHRRVFGHDSHSIAPLAAALPHAAGSPGLGVLRRLRPTSTLRQATRLSPHARGSVILVVPAFTVARSTGEAPGFAPAASSWLRRRPSPRPTRPSTYTPS
jgi:hypothetical protein